MQTISLIINTKNPKPEYLARCIKSIPFCKFTEVLIYIDEKHLQISNSEGIHFIPTPEHRKVHEGYNFLLDYVKTDWVLPFCYDDWFITEELIRLLDVALKTDKQVIHYPINLYDENGYCFEKWGTEQDLTYKKIYQKNLLPFASIIRKEVYDKIGRYDCELVNDWIFWGKALKAGITFEYWPTPIYNFQMHSDSLFQQQKKFGVDLTKYVQNFLDKWEPKQCNP